MILIGLGIVIAVALCFYRTLLGYQLVYVCAWGTYTARYDSLDRHAGRPIHESMGVAPPWAKMKIVKKHSHFARE